MSASIAYVMLEVETANQWEKKEWGYFMFKYVTDEKCFFIIIVSNESTTSWNEDSVKIKTFWYFFYMTVQPFGQLFCF